MTAPIWSSSEIQCVEDLLLVKRSKCKVFESDLREVKSVQDGSERNLRMVRFYLVDCEVMYAHKVRE